MAEQLDLPGKVVSAAAEMLDIPGVVLANTHNNKVGTDSANAYAAFQKAEALRAQPNDSGLTAAIDTYKQALGFDPNYALANARLARAYLRLYYLHPKPGPLAYAAACCGSAIQQNPNLVEGHLAQATFWDWTGHKSDALEETSKALSIDPHDPRALLLQGQTLTGANRWSDAEAVLTSLQMARPNYWLGYEELGIAYASQGKYAQAVQQFSAANLASPDQVLPLVNLSTTALQMGNVEDAIDFARRSLALRPNDHGYADLAAAARCSGHFDEALPYALKATELGPDFPGNWVELGDIYSHTKAHQAEALEAYTRAASLEKNVVQTNPADGPAWMVLALAQAKMGEFDESLQSKNAADKNYSDGLDSQLLKVRVLVLLGRREEALTTASACLNRGAKPFTFQSMPDIDNLRNDPRFDRVLSSLPGQAAKVQ